MNKRDILELKRRFTKRDCNFNRICGCYVNSEKQVLAKINEHFLNLEDKVFYKYLELAKKTLSGAIGNNLLELEINYDENNNNDFQNILLELRDCDLKNEDLVEQLFDHIIANYEYIGNYLILLFHDTYDVITKTSDNMRLDDSQDVHKYIICAICPVNLAKPALSYLSDENTFGARIQDWVVGAPDYGFTYPAFTDRSSDIHNLMYYTKDPKAPKKSFMEEGLFCKSRQTASEQKEVIIDVIKDAAEADVELGENLLMEFQQGLNDMVTYKEEVECNKLDPVLLSEDNIRLALEDSMLPRETVEKVENALIEVFSENPPDASLMIDSKALIAHEQKVKEQSLVKEVIELKRQLANELENVLTTEDIMIRATQEGIAQIITTQIDGKDCLVIPLK